MFSFLGNSSFARREKFVPATSSNENAPWASLIARSGQGVQTFENGVVYSGSFYQDRCHGFGTLLLPDRSVIRGTFINNRFVSGTITYFDSVSILCTMREKQNSNDDFLLHFEVTFESKFVVVGESKKGGNILSAEVRSPTGEVVAHFNGLRVKFRLGGGEREEVPKYIVVTRTWVYEGTLREQSYREGIKGSLADTVEFGDEGVQIWTKGLGYLRIQPKGQLVCKSLLRIFRKMCVFRETLFKGQENFCSSTCFPNGMIFVTKDEFEKGVLIFPNGSNQFLRLGCFLTDVLSFEGYLIVANKLIKCCTNDSGQFFVQQGNEKLTFEEFVKTSKLRSSL